MTAAAAVLSVMPIATGWGAGAGLQQPMAIALVGGLIPPTILTLVALPALYAIASSLRQRAGQIRFDRASRDAETVQTPRRHIRRAAPSRLYR